MLRRKRLPAELVPVHRAFTEVLEAVEEAKEALVRALPTSRAPGEPLAEALSRFEEGLGTAAGRMEGWRHPAVAGQWEACRAGLDDSLRLAEELRLESPELPFDVLAFTIQDLMAPLEPFEAAAEAFRSLRRSSRRRRSGPPRGLPGRGGGGPGGLPP